MHGTYAPLRRGDIHYAEDPHAAWRVWHDRRRAIHEILYARFDYLDPVLLHFISTQIELYVTCDDAMFERELQRAGVALLPEAC